MRGYRAFIVMIAGLGLTGCSGSPQGRPTLPPPDYEEPWLGTDGGGP